MPYLIDGHNLIGQMPGISLKELDDEEQLIRRLVQYLNATQKQAEVYFDNAAPGQAGKKKFGRITAVFVPAGQTADSAIQRRLATLKRAARTWTVVSSDRRVQAEARAAGASVLPSREFAEQIETRRFESTGPEEAALDESEIREWLAAFGAEDEEG